MEQTRARVAWVAARDRISHARRAGHPRTLCGERAVALNEAWPELRRCIACTAIVADTEGTLALGGSVDENMSRLAHGDR